MLFFNKLNWKINDKSRNKTFGTFSLESALDWVKVHRIQNSGIAYSDKLNLPYPEVTGYLVPSLFNWGEKELARELMLWEVSIQKPDGSFPAIDGVSYTFDTGQVMRGFVAVLDDFPEFNVPLKKACDWVLTQVQSDGRLATPSTEAWKNLVDDRIHLYVLPPLIEAGKKLGEKRYLDVAKEVLAYYKSKKDLVEFNTLSHFFAYIIEALYDLHEENLAKTGLRHIIKAQRREGSIPAYKNVSWVCTPGVAQFAVIWYKFGINELADKALNYLEHIQNSSGGFYGSYGKGSGYFPNEELSWTVKYFLDAYLLKIKSSFNRESPSFPDFIDAKDGRIVEILSFLGNVTGKKVLDVGCGKGRYLRCLLKCFPDSTLYGLDLSEEMLSFCPKEVNTVIGSMLDIKYPDSYFDCVLSVEAIEHAVNIEGAIKEMVRVLKPGGKIIIIDKNALKMGALQIEPWEQWFNVTKITSLLEKYGIKANHKEISYEQFSQPDGLFIAWEGSKTL
jgi:malonyl-CoA O-methyltransferase